MKTSAILLILFCFPALSEAGRWKSGTAPAGSGYTQKGPCYWHPTDSGPNQCRYKVVNSTCTWVQDSGYNQCSPATFKQQQYEDTKRANAALTLAISYLGYVPNADHPNLYETDELLYAMQQYGVAHSFDVSVSMTLSLLAAKPTLQYDRGLECRVRDNMVANAKRTKNALASLGAVYGGFWISAPTIGLSSIVPQLRWGMVILGNLSLLWGLYADEIADLPCTTPA